MSSSRTYQCLSCRLKQSAKQGSNNTRRAFHSTPSQQRRSRPKYESVKASSMGLSESRQPEIEDMEAHLRPYTAREKKLLAMKYTPEQMAAIEAGEKAIPTRDLVKQGRFRTDPMRIDYIDDFATVRPLVDTPSRNVKGDESAGLREGKQLEKRAQGQEKGAGDRQTRNKRDDQEVDPHMLRLMQQTGMTKEEIRRIRVKNLVTHRVVNQTRMGKIQSLYFLTIAGNMEGMLGIGEGKAAEDEDGRRQAMYSAIRNMKPIPRYEERTIYGEVEGKVGASVVKLSARPPGFGNRCQSLIYELARAAGISDLAARTPRSRNKMNVVKAAFQALTNQRLPEDVARARGKKLVDVRGVYYGGLVH
ncbi:putative 37S ribosomal protein S5, mitochondrial [Pseudocercospora fuligena]|uniref:Small ribosomal subunit protein uS5m n=1 Tax=Pseudocercospora fuligena TaxID=685502 RepID=A0A8H6R6I5_9PEZI|nr:putative 37S ribosomal protein S5, mitochondrial [Pseudocercospora fuligena]